MSYEPIHDHHDLIYEIGADSFFMEVLHEHRWGCSDCTRRLCPEGREIAEQIETANPVRRSR